LSDAIQIESRGHVSLLTLSNPPANTWTEQSLQLLKDIVHRLNQDKTNYSLVITGQGEKFFSAGADLKLFSGGDVGVASTMSRAFGEAFETLAAYEGVSIAAINGYAMGGGLECALACDLRIAEEQAVLALPEAKVGLLPCGGGTQTLTWAVGEAWAKRMILCGEQVNADTALRIGLIDEVTEKGASLNKALAMAEQVAKQSPSSVSASKKLIMAARNQPMGYAWAGEREAFVALFNTEDQKEGVNAFLEKRKPEWKNQ
jgi:enoyl-CoA hydratase/carnithine racemase